MFRFILVFHHGGAGVSSEQFCAANRVMAESMIASAVASVDASETLCIEVIRLWNGKEGTS